MSEPSSPAPERRDRPGRRRARLEDVAAQARVSLATASRALRQPDLVAEETRRRVDSAVLELGYIRDVVAGNLASGRTGQVAAVVPSFRTTAFANTIQGVSDVLLPRGLQLILADTNLSGDNEAKLVASLLGSRCDAMIFTDAIQAPAARAMLRAADIPVVETWTLVDDPIDMNVGFDNRAAARAATEHLIASGRRTIGMICGSLNANQRGRERRRGFLEAVRAHGLVDDLFAELPYPSEWKSSADALRRLLARAPGLEGVFCSGDTFAAGALFGAMQDGLAVPGRLALIGLGDLELVTQTVPPLSSALVPGYEIGRRAAEMVLTRLAGGTVDAKAVDLGFRLVRRGST